MWHSNIKEAQSPWECSFGMTLKCFSFNISLHVSFSKYAQQTMITAFVLKNSGT